MLARAVREVEATVERRRVTPAVRTKFQVVALLLREENARVRRERTGSQTHRTEQLKRLDGIATILAKTAVRDPALLALLAEDAVVSDAARSLKRDMLRAAGIEPAPEEAAPTEPAAAPPAPSVGSCPSRSSLDSWPTRSSPPTSPPPGRARSVRAAWPVGSCSTRSSARSNVPTAEPRRAWPCRRRPRSRVPGNRELMPHQAQLVAAAAAGHRTFLLADEPGLGKTAQALLAAEAANAYPLLVVVPSVVKTNWVREAGLWTPNRSATVVHGNGDTVDGFADIVVVNYEVLDRHVGWFGDFGFRGMVVDEAHFIKNKTSQRSQHVLELSERIRSRTARPLLMALTGTPLINDIEDFRAIWQFLGWIDETEPLAELMDSLEKTGLTPADPGFYSAARTVRDRPRHRPSPQGRCGCRHPRPPHRRPARRARREGRPFDPGGRARPRSPAGVAVRDRAGAAVGPVPTVSSVASTTTSCARWRRGSRRTRARRRPARTCSA